MLLNGNPHPSLMTEGCAHAGTSTKLRGNFKANPWWMLKKTIQMLKCDVGCQNPFACKKNVIEKKPCCQPIPRKIFQQLESDTGNLCDVIEKHRTIHFCTPSSLIRNCMVLMPHETHVHVKTNRRINKKVLLSNGLGQYGCLSIPYTFDCTGWKSYVQIHSELDSP